MLGIRNPSRTRLRNRPTAFDPIRAFHRSATTGKKEHAGGVTFHTKLDGDTNGLLVSTHLANGINSDPQILRPNISYAERGLIWEFVRDHGRLPRCNSE